MLFIFLKGITMNEVILIFDGYILYLFLHHLVIWFLKIIEKTRGKMAPRFLLKTSLPPPPRLGKMATVVERADGGVRSLDADVVSPRQLTPSPDQPHQNNPLLGLPIVAIETILNFLSYDEISLLRSVSWTRTGQLHGKQSYWQVNAPLRMLKLCAILGPITGWSFTLKPRLGVSCLAKLQVWAAVFIVLLP